MTWPVSRVRTLISLGGTLMIPFWVVFISLHGPTSFDQGGRLWGHGPLVWGSITTAPNLLIAAGLWGARRRLYAPAGRMARMGYVLVLIGLTVPALVNLATLTLGPPLLLPVEAIGLVMLALGSRRSPLFPRAHRRALFGLGVLLFLGFLWALAPIDYSDGVQGYGIFGIMTSVLRGAGWMIVGLTVPGHFPQQE